MFRRTHVRGSKINRRIRNSSRQNPQDKTSRNPIGSKVSSASNNNRKPTGNNVSNSNNSVSRKTTLQDGSNNHNNNHSNKRKGSKISNGNNSSVSRKTTLQDGNNNHSSKRKAGRISNSNNSISSRATLQDDNSNHNSKQEGSKVSSANRISSRIIGRHNSVALLKSTNSRLLGKVIVHNTGRLITALGSNAAVIAATTFRMTVSVPTMARITGSESTVSL